MTDPGPAVRLVAGVGLLTALSAGCAPPDHDDSGAGAGVSTPGRTAGEALPPVSLPDLSNLTAWAQDQVRARDAALRALEADAAASTAARVDAYGNLGLVLMATEYYEAAAASFRQAHALAPRDRRWPYYLGQLHLMTLDPAQAADWFERALERAPSDEATLVWLGRTRLDQGRPEGRSGCSPTRRRSSPARPRRGPGWVGRPWRGTTICAPRNRSNGPSSSIRARPASTIRSPWPTGRSAGSTLRTRIWSATARATRPWSTRSWCASTTRSRAPLVFERRGVQALAEGDWETAAGIFRQGLDLDPDDPSLRERLATALAMGGDFGAAVELLEETLRQAPAFARAHVSLAGIQALNGRFREAAARYRTALRLDPGSVEARMGLAEALRADGRLETSLAHYAQVAEIDPGAADAWMGRADALIRLGRYVEARAWLTDAQAVHPDHPDMASLAETVAAIIARPR